jgi:hypothetical protein
MMHGSLEAIPYWNKPLTLFLKTNYKINNKLINNNNGDGFKVTDVHKEKKEL